MTSALRYAAAMLASVLCCAAAAPAQAEKLGIVLMHGKQGVPERSFDRLAGQLEAAGYAVERPAMCWSRTRIYDRVFLDCIAEIDAAIESLKARGADAF